eukprot:933642-Rhodomonas_salina.1
MRGTSTRPLKCYCIATACPGYRAMEWLRRVRYELQYWLCSCYGMSGTSEGTEGGRLVPGVRGFDGDFGSGWRAGVFRGGGCVRECDSAGMLLRVGHQYQSTWTTVPRY